MATESAAFLPTAVAFLAGAVIAVPIAQRLGLGSVIGYLVAGFVLGPSLAGVVGDPVETLHIAEFGVVMLLFVIGLELNIRRLWSMRHDIFGLGAFQVALTGLAIYIAASFYGMSQSAAIVVGAGLSLSSTAIAMQLLQERGETNTAYGQKSFSVLLFQDLAIVPFLALVTLVSPLATDGPPDLLQDFLMPLAALTGLILAGLYLLNPVLRLLAKYAGREVMTAAALLVVLGSSALMELAGLSMALGAFLAGVLLAESSFRHQLEADIEPFRGLLMGLFFIAIGMSISPQILLTQWHLIGIGVVLLMAIKFATLYAAARVFRIKRADAVRFMVLLAQGGEFGFVMFATARSQGVLTYQSASLVTAIVTISMALTPLFVMAGHRFAKGLEAKDPDDMEEDFEGLDKTNVLMIGFGRFGQISSQLLLAADADVTIIDNDPDQIRSASKFGFRIYYGDGTRLDVLRKAGIEQAELVAMCTRNRRITDRIITLIRSEFPQMPIYARAVDRAHAIDLMKKGVDYQIRETFESAMTFGTSMLSEFVFDPDRIAEVEQEVRKRDHQRIELQLAEGLEAGRDLLHVRPLRPEPLVKPRHGPEALTEETREITEAGSAVDQARNAEITASGSPNNALSDKLPH